MTLGRPLVTPFFVPWHGAVKQEDGLHLESPNGLSGKEKIRGAVDLSLQIKQMHLPLGWNCIVLSRSCPYVE
ncbi:hypothetical protein DM77_2993 [Burkholderia mallei]|nr:hypothetical protein DM77_2993 [Burkholderia mallei]